VQLNPFIESDGRMSKAAEDKIDEGYGWGPYREAGTFLRARYVDDTLDKAVVRGEGDQGFGVGAPISALRSGSLRSAATVKGYRLDAKTGKLGRLGDFLISDEDWSIRHLVVAETLWWFEKDLLLSPSAVSEIDGRREAILLTLNRLQVKHLAAFRGLGRVARLEPPPH
jgi:hypothetical protein